MSNILESCLTDSPIGKNEECAKFVIDDPTVPFVMQRILTPGQEYTFSFWLMSDADGSVMDFPSTTSWQKYTLTFEATQHDLMLNFGVVGTYYIYHPQLEIGAKATDWTPAPEDTDDALDAVIELLNDSIRMLVTNSDGESVMTQTANGWTFDISKVVDSAAREDIEKLSDRIGDVEDVTHYVKIGTYDNKPCIELGESTNDVRLRITNSEIQFADGSSVPAYIANQNGVSKLMIEKADVKGELQIGDFVWKKRTNGNVGLMWIGGGS